MANIKYTSDGLFGLTPCPFGVSGAIGGPVKVNSHYCTHKCRYYGSTNYREKKVICLADCSSALKSIVDKIDTVIANEQLDDICFEEFIMDIREKIANVLDGGDSDIKGAKK